MTFWVDGFDYRELNSVVDFWVHVWAIFSLRLMQRCKGNSLDIHSNGRGRCYSMHPGCKFFIIVACLHFFPTLQVNIQTLKAYLSGLSMKTETLDIIDMEYSSTRSSPRRYGSCEHPRSNYCESTLGMAGWQDGRNHFNLL